MMRFEVDTGSLSVLAARHAALAGVFQGLGGAVGQTVRGAAGAAGLPELGGEMDAAASECGRALGELAVAMTGMSRNLSAAAASYDVTDQSVMPGG